MKTDIQFFLTNNSYFSILEIAKILNIYGGAYA